MPLTPLGAREVGIGAVVFCVGAIICISLFRQSGSYWHLAPILPLAVLFAWVLWFFRDPPRRIPAEAGVIVSPADGVISHLDTTREDEYIGGEALRCSIFMSVFNVHINRAPSAGTVEFVKFRPGEFFDARREESLVKNQNQDMGIRTSEPGMPRKMVVRQSTGAIARTIVCPVREGMTLRRGEKYGMIKFGSRVTLLLSPDAAIEWRVNVGDSVKGGETILAVVKEAK
jgi:phosphatidylserine decarboxylase